MPRCLSSLVVALALGACRDEGDGGKAVEPPVPDTGGQVDDADGDGHTAAEGDCDDADPTVHPGATDRVGDGVDQDCDGIDGTDSDGDGLASLASGGEDCDDADPDVGRATVWYVDGDGDGHGAAGRAGALTCEPPPGMVSTAGDCDDADAEVRPDAEEVCNGRDDDCDDDVDEDSCPVGFLADTGVELCFDATAQIRCPLEGEPFSGQDGNFVGPELALTPSAGGTAFDPLTALTWQAGMAAGVHDWGQAQEVCAALELDGSDDWRVPDRLEALTVLDLGQAGPALPDALPTMSRGYLWTSSEAGEDGGLAIDVESGGTHRLVRSEALPVRCVRGEAPLQQWVDMGDGTFEDERTGLAWAAMDDGVLRTWEQALAHCESLELAGASDWRLPDFRALHSAATGRFPVARYWSSTTDVQDARSAWTIGGDARESGRSDKAASWHRALCVRSLE